MGSAPASDPPQPRDCAAPDAGEGANRRLLEDRTPYGESMLWQLQHLYFAERGIAAWREGEVPHYVTSNPTVANAYSEILFAFRRDLAGKEGGDAPLHICELGAGSGRFAFHFLRRLAELCDEAGVARNAFRYVLTDVAPANLDFWRAHPSFKALLDEGLLEIASFDLMRPGDLVLEKSGETIGEGTLRGPLVVIANYVFDGVPQDLFHFRDGRAFNCLASLSTERDPDRDPAALLCDLRIDLEDAPLDGPAYAEPELQLLFADYRETFADTYLLFPAQALRGLRSLAGLSRQGLLLLSADMGEHRLEALDGCAPPDHARHGSISVPVNYHAFARFCEAAGGLALTPARRHSSIDMVGLLMVADPESYRETRRAYRRFVQEFSPDDFFVITRHARETISEMSVADILAYLRLSRHDSHQFGRYLPRLTELAENFDAAIRAAVREAADAVWAQYFPLGEALDLANAIAGLLYAMDDCAGALGYFERSVAIYGPDAGTLYNMACCCHLLGRDAEAAAMLDTVLRHDPVNGPACALREACEVAH